MAMQKRAISRLNVAVAGRLSPNLGVGYHALALGVAALALLGPGCSNTEEVTTLEPVVVGMTSSMEATVDEEELTYFEVKAPIAFPLLAPNSEWLASEGGREVDPYGAMPWLTPDTLRVQVSYTVTNLDAQAHNVELLVDPWNEFGRYWPGLRVNEDDEQRPSLSGIDIYFRLPGTDEGESSRRHGTLTFEDMEELARDFATVMSILEDPPAADDSVDDPTFTYVEHTFQEENRSHNDPLVQRYVPEVIAGLAGLDMGLRTRESANLALEVVVELVDVERERVLGDDGDGEPLEVPETYITAEGG